MACSVGIVDKLFIILVTEGQMPAFRVLSGLAINGCGFMMFRSVLQTQTN